MLIDSFIDRSSKDKKLQKHMNSNCHDVLMINNCIQIANTAKDHVFFIYYV